MWTVLEKPNLIFTVILTRQCNYRCDFCPISFSNNIISQETMTCFLDMLQQEASSTWYITLEFFWWEPLLQWKELQNIVYKTKHIENISYSITTNWALMTQEILDFLNEHNFAITFSITAASLTLLDKKFSFFQVNDLSRFAITLVIEPHKEAIIYSILKKLLKIWFRKFTILPSCYTTKWWDRCFHLDKLLKKISLMHKKLEHSKYSFQIYYVRRNKEQFYNINKQDYEFVIDVNGNIYADFEGELYILNDAVPDTIFSYQDIYLWNLLKKDFSLPAVIWKRQHLDTRIYTKMIAQYLGVAEDMDKMEAIMSQKF